MTAEKKPSKKPIQLVKSTIPKVVKKPHIPQKFLFWEINFVKFFLIEFEISTLSAKFDIASNSNVYCDNLHSEKEKKTTLTHLNVFK